MRILAGIGSLVDEWLQIEPKGKPPCYRHRSAAIEILMYGLLFVWSRNNQDRLGYDVKIQPVLAAENINLAVLAPSDYYREFELTNLVSALDNGLAEFGRRHGLALSFGFRDLDEDLTPDSRQKAPAEAGASLSIVGA